MNHVKGYNYFKNCVGSGQLLFVSYVTDGRAYQKSIRNFDRNNYSDLDFEKFSKISSKGIYSCLTCHGHFKKRKIPPQPV